MKKAAKKTTRPSKPNTPVEDDAQAIQDRARSLFNDQQVQLNNVLRVLPNLSTAPRKFVVLREAVELTPDQLSQIEDGAGDDISLLGKHIVVGTHIIGKVWKAGDEDTKYAPRANSILETQAGPILVEDTVPAICALLAGDDAE